MLYDLILFAIQPLADMNEVEIDPAMNEEDPVNDRTGSFIRQIGMPLHGYT